MTTSSQMNTLVTSMDTITRVVLVINLCLMVPVYSDGICDDLSPCGVEGQCQLTDSSPGYKCQCYAGFIQENPQSCVDRNECNIGSDLCHNGTCVNTHGSFTCKCNTGFAGQRCTQKANPCDSSPCLNGAKCTPTNSSSGYKCTCYSGFLPPNCADRDECSIAHNLCHTGTCVNTLGSFKCTCNQGYSGPRCMERDPCASSPCQNGKCTASTSGPGYTCSCYAGFVPPNCTDRNECAMVANLCHNGTCVNTPGSFKCNCNAGFAGSHCTKRVTQIDHCGSSPCLNGGTCSQSIILLTGYTCSCPTGFNLPNCNDNDECKFDTNLCHNGTCVNTVGSFRCQCNKGYTGIHCTVQTFTSSQALTTTSTTARSSTSTTARSSTSTTTSSSPSTVQTTTIATGNKRSYMASNLNNTKPKVWTSSHWYVFVIVAVVVGAAAVTGAILVIRSRRRPKNEGVYNRFDQGSSSGAPSTPNSANPIQQENPLYMAIQNSEITDPDAAAASAAGPGSKQDKGMYMTLTDHGNNDSDI